MTTPTPIGESLSALMQQLDRTRAAQRRAQGRRPGSYTPAADDDVGPAGQQQAQWERIVGPALASWRLSNLHVTEIVPALARAVKAPPDVLVLMGRNGSGKSASAAALLHQLWDGGRHRVLFRSATALLEGWLDRDPDLRAGVDAAAYAVVDDLGSESVTDHRQAALLGAWDRLVGQGARLIVTTNLNAKEREHQLGPALASRTKGTIVRFPNEDLRGRGLPAPLAPPTTPCPFHCGPNGSIELRDLPDAHDRIVAQLYDRGIREPDPAKYPTSAEGDEALVTDVDAWERAYGHHASSIVWCPHCRPDKQPPPRPDPVDDTAEPEQEGLKF